MKYFIKTPWWLKKLYSSYIWSIDTKHHDLYLTFDDGPHPVATPFVLDELKKYNAKATFFCIGKNVVAGPAIYRRILDEGHAIGNHTHNHLNGWKTRDDIYLADVREAAMHIDSKLFRPPYGRITSFQARNIKTLPANGEIKIIMWDVISGDFDESIDGEQCLKNVVMNAGKGSIIVCHDSQKALPRLEKYLPLLLKYFTEKGFGFKKIAAF
jgi:peptidoglycan/xylan/chitin deacetylase (PgdA/CDA1 family)